MRWEQKEIDCLKKMYHTKIPLKDISRKLKRSTKAIKHKAARLRLSRPNTPVNKPKNKNHRNEYDKRYYEENKKKIYENKKKRVRQYKIELLKMLGGKCKICGYNKCLAAFDFHHKDGVKEGNINRLLKNVSKKKLLKEAKKCILLCSNCHRELHHNIGGIV